MRRSTRLVMPLWGVVLFLGTCGSGCDTLGDGGPSVEHDLRFQVVEDWGDSEKPVDPALFLKMETADTLRCVNFRIQHTLERRGSQLIVRVLDVELPTSVCLTALGPAKARRRLSIEPGTYTLTLVNGSGQDAYEVSVTEHRVTVEPSEGEWTAPSDTLFRRYPRRSFGYYCGTTDDTKGICDQFRSRLQGLSLTSIDVPDRGHWPYRRQVEGHHYNAPVRFYRYPDSETWNLVKDRFRTFARRRVQGTEGVGLRIVNWRADIVRSWIAEDGE